AHTVNVAAPLARTVAFEVFAGMGDHGARGAPLHSQGLHFIPAREKIHFVKHSGPALDGQRRCTFRWSLSIIHSEY
ncbi:MAG TPA: hypothetical protein VGM01_14825, partial [Ktedonobacteraceae bacterium]